MKCFQSDSATVMTRIIPVYYFLVSTVFATLICFIQLRLSKFGSDEGRILVWIGGMILPQLAIVVTKAFEQRDIKYNFFQFIWYFVLVIFFFLCLFSVFAFDNISKTPGFSFLFETTYQAIALVIDSIFGLLFYFSLHEGFKERQVV